MLVFMIWVIKDPTGFFMSKSYDEKQVEQLKGANSHDQHNESLILGFVIY